MTETARPLIEVFSEMTARAEVATANNGPYCHFNWDRVRNDRDNIMFRLNWHDDEGQAFSCSVNEEAFDPENHPSFKDGIFRLLDTDGEPTEIRFYKTGVIEVTYAKTVIKELKNRRETYGHDERAINRHAVRVYQARLEGFVEFYIDKTLDGCPPFYCLYYFKGRSALPTYLNIKGKQYWGIGLVMAESGMGGVQSDQDIHGVVIKPSSNLFLDCQHDLAAEPVPRVPVKSWGNLGGSGGILSHL